MHSAAGSPFAQQNSQTAQANGSAGPSQGGLLAASGIGGLTQPASASVGGDQGAGVVGSGSGVGVGGGGLGQARSRDSMMASGAWHASNGRHSPDAFAQLSARAVR